MVEAPNSHRTKVGRLYDQRFNVALSRARDRMYLVRSVDESILKPDDLKAKVIQHFKKPMEGSPMETQEAISLCQSDFEREVYQKLFARGGRVRRTWKVSEYSITLLLDGVPTRRLSSPLTPTT